MLSLACCLPQGPKTDSPSNQLFAGTSSPDTWLQHAKGIGVLMEQRGPAAHAEGWDAAMLLSFRGILVCFHFLFLKRMNPETPP